MKLTLLDRDVQRLEKLLGNNAGPNHQYCAALREEIKKAKILPQAKLPPRAVTMYSTVTILDMENQETQTYTLVYPGESDPDNDKISILAPIGTALIGYSEGDEIRWNVPGGMRKFKILSVQQPA